MCPDVDAGLWVERHAPQTREQLVVHKDKVAAVEAWLHKQAASQHAQHASCCLLITGEPSNERMLHGSAVAFPAMGLTQLQLCVRRMSDLMCMCMQHSEAAALHSLR